MRIDTTLTRGAMGSAVCAALLWAGTAQATPTPAQKCAAAKLKAIAKTTASRLKCYAKAAKAGTAVDSECLLKATQKFVTAFIKAEEGSGCIANGDVVNKDTAVSDFVDGAVRDTPAARDMTVFVTSTKHDGNFGGLAGADTICNNLAAAAGLSGTYKAWLADDTTSAVTRLTHSSVPYRLVDGTEVADNWADVTDSSLWHAISMDETGQTVVDPFGYEMVFTGTYNNGTSEVGQNCNNWTSNSYPTPTATVGILESGSGWNRRYVGWCNTPSRLYCFEQ